MAKTLGYMVTLTTYGTWLQGNEKGFVKDGVVRGENVAFSVVKIRIFSLQNQLTFRQ